MNGRSPLPDPPSPAGGREDADLLRFSAALLASAVLHATAILLPFLGISHKTARPGLAVTPDPGHPLQVTLKPPRKALDLKAPSVPTVPTALTATLPPAPPTPETSVASTPVPLPDAPPALKPSGSIAPAAPETAVERSLGGDVLPSVAAPEYYALERLTKRPQPMTRAPLDTPETTPIVGSGSLIMKLWIDSFGQVVKADVEKTTMPGIFSPRAIDAFRRVHFIPGEINGRAVGVVMRIEVRYQDGRALP